MKGLTIYEECLVWRDDNGKKQHAGYPELIEALEKARRANDKKLAKECKQLDRVKKVRVMDEKDLLVQQLRRRVAELEAELNQSIPRDAAAKIVDRIDTFTMGWRDNAVAQIMAFTREEEK